MIETNREPPFYLGVVEDRSDPLKIGRVRVRVIGLHTHDKVALPTEDLPWCYCIQPVSSAAMSGIGQSPVGPVEGTWVAVQFMDVDKQNPFVVGTLPGISQSQSFFNNSPNQGGNYEVKKDGTLVAPWLDYGDQPIGDGKFNMPGGYSTSNAMIEKIKAIEKFEAKPYKDVKGVWTIGYGTTYIDGAPVSQTTPEITEAKASELFTRDLALFEAAVKSVVLVPVTQSMFDAMVSLTYNIGAGAFRKSTLVKEINSKNYAAAAEQFMEWIYSGGKIITGLQTRRQSEKTWFLREGTGESGTGTVQTASMSIRSARIIGGTSNSASTSNNNPLSKILDFNSAGSFVLPDDEKQKLISSGGVKILSKEEYWSVINVPPAPVVSGSNAEDVSANTSRREVIVECSHIDLLDAKDIEAFKEMPFTFGSRQNNLNGNFFKGSMATRTDKGFTLFDESGNTRRPSLSVIRDLSDVLNAQNWYFKPLKLKISTGITKYENGINTVFKVSNKRSPYSDFGDASVISNSNNLQFAFFDTQNRGRLVFSKNSDYGRIGNLYEGYDWIYPEDNPNYAGRPKTILLNMTNCPVFQEWNPPDLPDSIELFVDLGDLVRVDYLGAYGNQNKYTTILENVWIKFWIPIDKDFGKK